MEDTSRNIPLPIKREVRRRCGFGCIICGIPLYDYDHIEEWSQVKEHKAENVTLLCDRHHREKTSGLLTIDQVRRANQEPFNIKNRISTPYNLHFEGKEFEIQIGKLTISIDNINPHNDFMIPFLVDDIPLIGFVLSENQLYFNLLILDENDTLLLKIEENELVFATDQWDIEFVATNLKLREKQRGILLDIDFLIPRKVRLNKGVFNYHGWPIEIDNYVIRTTGISFSAMAFKNFRYGFILGTYSGSMPAVVRKGN